MYSGVPNWYRLCHKESQRTRDHVQMTKYHGKTKQKTLVKTQKIDKKVISMIG